MDPTKILTQIDTFDGTTRCPPKDLESLKFVDDRTDTTEGSHEVFEEKYKSEEYNRVPQEFQNDWYFTSILGWTQKLDEILSLVSLYFNNHLPELRQARHYRQNIFPVITQLREVPIVDRNWAETIKGKYEMGHYLILISVDIRITPTVVVILNGNQRTLYTLRGRLFYICFRLSKETGRYERDIINRVHRILDPIDNINCDYPVFGMYAGGRPDMAPPMHFSGEVKKRLCFDQYKYNPNATDFSFRTEISYDWRSRRVGYYCSRNALLLVSEYVIGSQAMEVLNSLLRESTFVVGDGIHIYKTSQVNWNYQIRDMDPSLILEPIIAIATEGLSHLYVTKNQRYYELRDIYYTLENRCVRPLLLNWIDFENDWNPIEANISSFVSQQHRFKRIMKKNEFFDYILFPNIGLNEEERIDVVFTMNYSVNIKSSGTCQTSWHCYGCFQVLGDTHYYYYLGSFHLYSAKTYGDFRDPWIYTRNDESRNVPKLFGKDQVEITGYPELLPNRIELIQSIKRMLMWYKTEEIDFRENNLYKNCIRKLKYIFQTRNPTVNSEIRFGKTQSVWEQWKQSDVGFFRRFHQRFWQIVKRKDLQDYIPFVTRYALVMAELPEPIHNKDKELTQMIERWDIYELFMNAHNISREDHLFKLLVSVKLSYKYHSRDQCFTSKDCVIERQEFPIEMEKTIDRRWYPLEINDLTADHMVEYSPQLSDQDWNRLFHHLEKEARTILRTSTLTQSSFWSDIRTSFIENYPKKVSIGNRKLHYHQILDEIQNPPQKEC